MTKEKLENLYVIQNRSVAEIATIFSCSQNKINYWLKKFSIPKRSISEAIYRKYNPQGDPFKVKHPVTIQEAILYGVGIGLYWGEGTKSNRYSIRLGNTDPRLIKKFITFLKSIYNIDVKKLRFGLQVFSDMSLSKALNFWQKELGVSKAQFQKVITTPARSLGTYRNKSQYGVLTVYYGNKKLRNILMEALENV